MEMDKKGMMNEVGGAFVVSWLVLSGMGQGMGSLTGALVLAGAWMAFSGAHILPAVTWMHIMTGDVQDTNNWMNNGMKLVMQVIGAALACRPEPGLHSRACRQRSWCRRGSRYGSTCQRGSASIHR